MVLTVNGATSTGAVRDAIVDIAATSNAAVVLLQSGTLYSINWNNSSPVTASTWTNVIKFVSSCTGDNFAALKADGTAVYSTIGGSTYDLSGVSNANDIAIGDVHIAVMYNNGTVAIYADIATTNSYNSTNYAGYLSLVTVPSGLANVKSVKAGMCHTLALKADGTVVTWGGFPSADYASAYGSLVTSSLFTIPTGLSQVKEIFTGPFNSAALKADGTVVVWGDNSQGQCNVPTGLNNVKSLAFINSFNVVALKADGTVVIWGATNPTISGTINNIIKLTNSPYLQLADGTVGIFTGSLSNTSIVARQKVLNSFTTYPNNLKLKAKAISCYNGYLALKADGSITQDNDQTVTISATNLVSNVIQVVKCTAAAIVLRADGTVYAWGGNTYGVTNVPAGLSNVIKIVGAEFVCAALKADGTVVGWGQGALVGQTGIIDIGVFGADGTGIGLKATGTLVGWSGGYYTSPTIPSGLANVKAISAGYYGALALKADGTPVAFGNDTLNVVSGMPTGLTNVREVSAGRHISGLVKGDGSVAAWGDSSDSSITIANTRTNVKTLSMGGNAIGAGVIYPNLNFRANANSFSGPSNVTTEYATIYPKLNWIYANLPSTFAANTITMSSSGAVQTAVRADIYTSLDYGVTWNKSVFSLPGPYNNSCVAMSSDGTKQMVGSNQQLPTIPSTYSGKIYKSTDSGATWTVLSTPDSGWVDIKMSADGTKITAIQNTGGGVYRSIDSGANWTLVLNAGNNIAMSSDGTKQLVTNKTDGKIYKSVDSGATWTALTSLTAINTDNRYWKGIAMSANGTKITALVNVATGGDIIYISADSGSTWNISQYGAGDKFQWVCMSSDGTKQLVVTRTNSPLISSVSLDSGVTWAQYLIKIPLSAIYLLNGYPAMSSDGTRVSMAMVNYDVANLPSSVVTGTIS